MENKKLDINTKEAVETVDIEVAEKEAKTLGRFTYKFITSVIYNGTNLTELAFDFDKLTGRDARAIEEELKAQGKFSVTPAFDNGYLCKALAKACDSKIGDDLFFSLGLRDYNKLCSKARSFFLSTEE